MNRPSLLAAASAAILVPAAPAAAQQFTASSGFTVFQQAPQRSYADSRRGSHVMPGDRHHRRDRRRGTTVVVPWGWDGGAWAYYNNRSFEPDSYNDWWHDRPDRAYPRWVRESRRDQDCDPDRMWWSGSGWHC